MKLVCSKPQLVDIINTVQRAIAPKTSLPILECIKIDANGDGNVVFTGNNIDIIPNVQLQRAVLLHLLQRCSVKL